MHTAAALRISPAERAAFADSRFAPVQAAPPPHPAAPATQVSGFHDRRRVNWGAVAVIAAAHVALGIALMQAQVIQPPVILTKLDVFEVSEPPAPAETPPPPQLIEPEIYVPPPAIEVARPAPPILTTIETPPVAQPVKTLVSAAPTPAPVPPTVVSTDLGATMISARPPAYPLESRRQREQGTVVLMVLLGADGRVTDIRVHSSSGHDRLDRAALGAVQRWRWSPTLRDGAPVSVRGLVEIPFVLRG